MSYFRIVSLLAALIGLCIGPAPASAQKEKPKLVLAIIIDQFRYDYLLRFRNDYKGGLATLLKEGAVFADAHYPQFPTVTAVGHSTFMSGATPSLSGIIGNDWFERTPFITDEVCREDPKAPKGVVASVADASTCLVGSGKGKRGSSPRRLLVSTLGDELKLADPNSLVFGISLKDRGAILTSGHQAKAAYWFDSDLAVSSTYYMTDLPDWVVQFNKDSRDKVDNYKWVPLDKPNQTFCSIKKTDGVRLCGYEAGSGTRGKVENSPLANDLVEELAGRLLENEKLGSRNSTDMLTISFSANDYVGHELGPYSVEVKDIAARTDELLQKLFKRLADAGLGGSKTLIVLSADHGVAATPKQNRERRLPGGFVYMSDIQNKIGQRLSEHFQNAGVPWISSLNNGVLYLNNDAISSLKLEATEVRKVAAEAIRDVPKIARVYTRDDLNKGAVGADHVARAVQLGYYGPRSGDVIFLPEPNFLFAPEPGTYDTGTTHFTPYTYDTHVPVIFHAPGLIKGGTRYNKIFVNDVAPTLAALLGIEAPSGSSGRVLSEIFE